MFLCVSWLRSLAILKGTNLSRINRRFPHDSPLTSLQSFPSSTLIFPHRARPDTASSPEKKFTDIEQ